jgi:hypothetical protein
MAPPCCIASSFRGLLRLWWWLGLPYPRRLQMAYHAAGGGCRNRACKVRSWSSEEAELDLDTGHRWQIGPLAHRHQIESPKRDTKNSTQGRLAADSRPPVVQIFVRLSVSFRQPGAPNGGRHAAVWRQTASFRTWRRCIVGVWTDQEAREEKAREACIA